MKDFIKIIENSTFDPTDEEAVMVGAHYNIDNDKSTKASLSDTRKERITLASLNKLKSIRAIKELEKLKRNDLKRIMYQASDDGM